MFTIKNRELKSFWNFFFDWTKKQIHFIIELITNIRGIIVNEKLIGTWVEVEIAGGKKWVGRVEEWDEEALFISNGFEFGHKNHKGAECTNEEAIKVTSTELREFSLE